MDGALDPRRVPPLRAITTPPRLPRTASKFREGSMDDRVSSAPPACFLGPDDERDWLTRPRPSSAGAAATRPDCGPGSDSSSLFSRPWWGGLGGLRSLVMRRGAHAKSKPRPQSWHQSSALRSPTGQRSPGRPSRDHVLKGYTDLLASDFFASRTIQSTRQPPPGLHLRTTHGFASADRLPPASYRGSPTARRLVPHTVPPESRPQPEAGPHNDKLTHGTKRRHFTGPDEEDQGRTRTLKKLRISTSRLALQTFWHSHPSPAAGMHRKTKKFGRLAPTRHVTASQPALPSSRVLPSLSAFGPVSGTTAAAVVFSSATTPKWAATVPRNRRNVESLSVIPDPNRGIPVVPPIPEQFRPTAWETSRIDEPVCYHLGGFQRRSHTSGRMGSLQGRKVME